MKSRRPGTTVEDVHQRIRDSIISGNYRPGFRLSQQALATELKVSRTPLREALSRLAAEGLVVGEANHGMEVAPVYNEDAEQSYALRLLIETPVIEAIVEDITEQEIDRMQKLLTQMEQAADNRRIEDFRRLHYQFHEATLRHYPVSFLELIRSLYAKIYRHQRLYFSRPEVPKSYIQLDRAFCDAMRGRDAAAARQHLEFHLTDKALGMVLDIDPDHKFDSLLIALHGLGIELEADVNGRIHRPARIRWVHRELHQIAPLSTNNLYYGSDDSRRSTPAADH